jgi:hypothetical protein
LSAEEKLEDCHRPRKSTTVRIGSSFRGNTLNYMSENKWTRQHVGAKGDSIKIKTTVTPLSAVILDNG